MSRHRADHSPLRIAPWIFVALVVVAIAVTATWVWDGARERQQASDEAFKNSCPAGTIEIPVAQWRQGAADSVISAFESMGTVRDYCLKPVITDDVQKAAILVAPSLAHTSREAVDSTVVGTTPVFLHEPDTTEAPAAQVVYPVADLPQASAAATKALAHSSAEADNLLHRDRFVTAEIARASGRPFVTTDSGQEIPGADIPVSAWALAATNASPESEEILRVSRSLIDALPAESISTEYYEAVPAPSNNPVATLYLIDTSDAAAPWLGSIASGMGTSAAQLEAQGKPIAVWNYSSPLNEGVNKPWRVNTSFGQANAGEIAARWGTGGVPQTRMSLLAAAEAASTYSNETKQPVRVVLVTTGSAHEPLSDADFAARFGEVQAMGEVMLDVVHLGSAPVDPVIAETAQSVTQLAENKATPETFARVSGVFGE